MKIVSRLYHRGRPIGWKAVYAVGVTLLALPILVASPLVAAHAGHDHEEPLAPVTTQDSRLKGAKRQVCERREKAVLHTFFRLTDRAAKQHALLTTISTRVQALSGTAAKQVPDYRAKVNEVEAKKSAAQTALDELTSLKNTFSCEADSPKAALQTFRNAHQQTAEQLKEYRTAVRNLVVSVRGAR